MCQIIKNMSSKTAIKKSANSVSANLLKTSEPKSENSSNEVEELNSGESLIKIFKFLPPTNQSELKKLKGFWQAMKAVDVKPQRGVPRSVFEDSKKSSQENVSTKYGPKSVVVRVNKEPVMNYVESFEYEEIVRLNEWKGQQQRDKEKQAALRAILPPPCCCKTCGLRPVGCACPAEEVSQQQLIPLATDQLTCHLDCICDQDDESESIDHTIRSVNNLEEQYECNSKNQGCDYDDTTSVKEECDCKPFCSCNRVESVRSNSVKSCEQHLINQQTLFDSKNDSKNCECSTICYCESKGSTSCLCCFCNRITSTFADLDQVDNVSSGMKLLKQCECESLCECENSDRFSVDYMKELDDLRQKTEDVNVSSCKLEQLKETFRESDIVSEPGCDFFKRLKSETRGEMGEQSSFDRFVEEMLVKYKLPACECNHSDCDCQNGSAKKMEEVVDKSDNSCECEISSTCKCKDQEDAIVEKPPVFDKTCGTDLSEEKPPASKATMCFVCGHFGCGCQDDESGNYTHRKFYMPDFEKKSWKGDYEGLDACFIEVSEIVDDGGETVKRPSERENRKVVRISVGCNTTPGQDKCL